MLGRVEHNIIAENNISELLNVMPDYVSEYYFSYKTGRLPKACLEYLRKIRSFLFFINPNPKTLKASSISKIDIVRYLDSISYITDRNGNKREASISYRKQVHSVLTSFFGFLYEADYIDSNPMIKIKRPRGKDAVKRSYLTVDDMKNVIKNADEASQASDKKDWGIRDKAILMLFMQTGMRETALSEINIEDIDLNERKLKGVIEKGHKNREFTLSEEMCVVLSKWIDIREHLLKDKSEDALFISNRRKRLNTDSISKIVKKYTFNVMGVKMSPHKLRRSYANMMLEATNGNIYVVQQLLGHASPVTTEIYLDGNTDKYSDLSASIVSKNLFK